MDILFQIKKLGGAKIASSHSFDGSCMELSDCGNQNWEFEVIEVEWPKSICLGNVALIYYYKFHLNS